MNSELLLQRFNILPENLQVLVFGYVDYLLESYKKISLHETQAQVKDEITPEIKALLDKRITEYEKNPQNIVTWDEVKTKFNKKYGYAV